MMDEISNEALVLAQDLGRELIFEECTDDTLKDSQRPKSDREELRLNQPKAATQLRCC
jgi:hypothetical protein